MWLALTDVRLESGPMAFLKGSHRHVLPTLETYQPENLLTRGQVSDNLRCV